MMMTLESVEKPENQLMMAVWEAYETREDKNLLMPVIPLPQMLLPLGASLGLSLGIPLSAAVKVQPSLWEPFDSSFALQDSFETTGEDDSKKLRRPQRIVRDVNYAELMRCTSWR